MPTELAKHSQEINTFICSQDIDILLVSERHSLTRATAISLGIIVRNVFSW